MIAWQYPIADELPKHDIDIANIAHQLSSFQVQPCLKENSQRIEYDIVWEPIKNSSQELAMTCPAHHILYCGARGPGKSITQLMRFRSRVGIGYGSYWRGIIFDREFRNLSDMVAQTKRFFPKFEDGAEWHNAGTEYKWVWPTGEELLFRHVKKLEDYDGYHGHEYSFVGWNELTKHPKPDVYDKFMTINRSSFIPEIHTPKINQNGKYVYNTHNKQPLPPIPLEVFSTTNPAGPGHGWVKKRFISPAKYGELVRRDISYFNPVENKEVTVIRMQCAIFGSFYENPYLDPVYKAGVIESCQHEPHLYEAWVRGSWDVTAGGAIDDLWNSKVHIIDRFQIPSNWRVDRSFDWGSSHPCGCVWWAEANGEEVHFQNGEKWCPQRGSLIAIADDYTVVNDAYGKPDYSQNKGLKLSASDVAIRIKRTDDLLIKDDWISKAVQAGPADNQIRDVRESDVETIEQKMAKVGVRWQQSDKSKGSRINGLQLMRDRLQSSVNREKPGIYFMRNCQACIELLPTLPRDPDNLDDVDTEAMDHIWDAVRYRVLKGSNQFAGRIQTRMPY